MDDTPRYLVAVVGAGPAGLFAARELAAIGAHVALFNRDIKPGGLAEYGIYPDKLKMKVGLRAQFKQTLANPNVEYYGNVTIGAQGDLTLAQLWQMGFQAILVTAGAQGTKWLGLPGEHLHGVFHAKELVYHYNHLPPFSQQAYKFGKRVAIIGAGNVMVDIARYLIERVQVDEVAAFVRRGPMEIKFDRKQVEYIAPNLDWNAYSREIDRVAASMRTVGQDPEFARRTMQQLRTKAGPAQSNTCFWMRFLSSPAAMLDNGQGSVAGLDIEETRLEMGADEPRAVPTGQHKLFEMDSVIFAIGDRVDETLGLPVRDHLFQVSQQPRFPQEGVSYEIGEPQSGLPLPGLFVAGWSRKASSGLVGIARKDGVNAAQAVGQYLQSLSAAPFPGLERLHAALQSLQNKPLVTQADLLKLEAVERVRARVSGRADFQFDNNEDMLAAMQLAHPVNR